MNRGPSGGRELRQLLETIEAVRAEQHGRALGILPALENNQAQGERATPLCQGCCRIARVETCA